MRGGGGVGGTIYVQYTYIVTCLVDDLEQVVYF